MDQEPINMLRGRDLLCFSHDWSGDPLSKTHLMRLLARHNRVLWVNSIGYRAPTASTRDLRRALGKLSAAMQPVREVERNIFVLNPLVIPPMGGLRIDKLNARWLGMQVRRAMRRLHFIRPINWVFNPAAAVVAGALGESGLIYYCVDEYPAFAGVRGDALAAMERQLLRRADLVVVSAQRLYESKRALNRNTLLVRHGVDYDHFRTALDDATEVPRDIADLPRPIIGYFGLIAEDWVDLSLIEATARRHPSASIVMLGRSTMDTSRLSALPNVHLLGRRSYADLPAYCRAFDVGLIPFPLSEVTLNANPLKAREYLAAGLPVVSSAIPEVAGLAHCRIGRDAEGFAAAVTEALQDSTPRTVRSHSMRSQTWESRLRAVEAHLAGVRPDLFDPAPLRGASDKATKRRRDEGSGGSDPSSLRRFVASSLKCDPWFRLILSDLRGKALWCYESDRPAAVFKALLTDGTAAMLLYRLMQAARRRRLWPLEMLFNKLCAIGCNCIIGRGAEFGPGFVLVHSTGVVINGQVRGGSNIIIEHQVTIGAERRRSPVLGDGVFIGAGAKVIGNVTIGSNARIGANAVVLDDVPDDCTAVGIPARIIRRQTLREAA